MAYVCLALFFISIFTVSVYLQIRRQLILGYDNFIETGVISKLKLNETHYSLQSDFRFSLRELKGNQDFMSLFCVKNKFTDLNKLWKFVVINISSLIVVFILQII
jgi:hypothetical protein